MNMEIGFLGIGFAIGVFYVIFLDEISFRLFPEYWLLRAIYNFEKRRKKDGKKEDLPKM